MKRRRNIFIIVVLIVASIAAIPFVLRYQAKARLEAYKKELIAAGEKLTIEELIPVRPEGENGAKNFWTGAAMAGRFANDCPPIIRMIQSGKGQAAWQRREAMEETSGKIIANLWPILAREIALQTNQIIELREALQQPAFYFSVDYKQGFNIYASHLPALKQAEWELVATLLLQLHEGQTNEAFENLLAAIKLPRILNQEPLLISQYVRYADLSIAFEATWAALQHKGWTDAQLLTLQQAWDNIDIIPAAIAAMAMERAMGPQEFEQGRLSYPRATSASTNSLAELQEIGENVLQNPAAGWKSFADRYPRYWIWQWIWSYDDERQMMKYWQQSINRLKAGYYDKKLSMPEDDPALEGPEFLLSRMERAVIERSVQKTFQPMTQAQTVMTAIALERYHRREGKYPAVLQDLIPAYLKKIPIDCMDGKELRYHAKSDGTFLLYSVGQNGTDEGGDATPVPNRTAHYLSGLDWVWPQPATDGEVAAFESGQKKNIPPISIEEKYRQAIHADR